MRGKGAGFSLVELLVILGIVGILVTIAIPAMNRSTLNLISSVGELEAYVRVARGNATGRGVHYRITLHSDYYEIDRLHLSGGAWVHDPVFTVQTITLPPTVRITTGAGRVFEFNSRGLLQPPSVERPSHSESGCTLHDSKRGETTTVGIWPSGQIIRS